MSKQNGIPRRNAPAREVCHDDRDRHIMSVIRRLRPLGYRTSLKKVKAILEEDRGKPHCKVIEDMMLDSMCKGYCQGLLEACRVVIDRELYKVAKKALKSGFLPLSEIASILKLDEVQVKKLQASMA